jgi:hypothetical protein
MATKPTTPTNKPAPTAGAKPAPKPAPKPTNKGKYHRSGVTWTHDTLDRLIGLIAADEAVF